MLYEPHVFPAFIKASLFFIVQVSCIGWHCPGLLYNIFNNLFFVTRFVTGFVSGSSWDALIAFAAISFAAIAFAVRCAACVCLGAAN